MSLFHLSNSPQREAPSRASSVFDTTYQDHEQPRVPNRTLDPNSIYIPILLNNRDEPLSGSYLVISGGTGCNAICSAFPQSQTCYVLPVSDDGGSSSEIIRVLQGPSIGDIRSRLIRLIPTNVAPHVDAIRNFLSYRFPSQWSEKEARENWRDVVEGRSPLWEGIPPDRKELIRGFLVYFENELLKRAHRNFSFRNGSIGNFFLSATQMFFRSLPSAIFQFSCITGSEGIILPVLVTNHTVTIAAELENGEKIVGQCNISHPVSNTSGSIDPYFRHLEGLEDDLEPMPPINLQFHKESEGTTEDLQTRIKRVFYINAYGQEIYPSPNPEFLSNLSQRDFLIYSCGSLWTSIIPCLALRGVASGIARSSTLRAKVLLLNYKNDRETTGYTALDYVKAITDTLNRHELTPRDAKAMERQPYPVSAFVTHLIYLADTPIVIEERELAALGVECVSIMPTENKKGFDAKAVRAVLERII
ncbi:UPF0052-domain-containing protein [Serendipita vermifera]|nr:UPF0052-domain-containing protein [Serendipita vermifera]